VQFEKLGHKYLWVLPLKIWGSKRENSGPDFGQLTDLTAKNFEMQQDIVNQKML